MVNVRPTFPAFPIPAIARTTPSPLPLTPLHAMMRGHAIGTKRKVPECAIKLRETYGATRVYSNQ